MKQKIVVYWSRKDFRLHDNPALFASIKYARQEKLPLLPIFILEDYMLSANPKEQFGYPSRIFLSKALPAFGKNFKNFTIFSGKAAQTMKSLADLFDITVFVNEDVFIDFYTQIKSIKKSGVNIKLFNDVLTISKETKTGSGKIYSIFTPFKNAVMKEFSEAKVLPKADLSNLTHENLDFGDLANKIIENSEQNLISLFSQKRIFLAGGVEYDIDLLLKFKGDYSNWYFEESAAIKNFEEFLQNKISVYKDQRDQLDSEGTSRMSLALAWGLISARSMREKIDEAVDSSSEDVSHYISELIWREFYKYLLFHKPELMNTEFQEKFRGSISWVANDIAQIRFKKWIQGETGYPIVDAAMMELAKTGYMHNRARMIVASVLTKNFGVDWRWGQEYFRAMLIDIDEASNNGGWQWGASVGADPKPIRIFNPYLQAKNYDKNGLYQKKFLRENYFSMPPEVLIEHKEAREDALVRYGLSEAKNLFPRDY